MRPAALAVIVLGCLTAGARGQTNQIGADELMETVRTLASPEFEGRGAGTPGGLKARAWVEERFKAAGLRPIAGETLVLPFHESNVDGANIAGACPGKRADAPRFIVSAHYDHLGVRNGSTFPGADDNASGVAVLLALASRCTAEPYSRSVVFVAFDAEERRLAGSRAFVQSPPFAMSQVALDVNLDMVARGDKGELYVAGTTPYPQFKPALEGVAARSSIKVLFGHDKASDGSNDWTMQSDHGAFHKAGVPFLYFGVEDHPDYHRASDTADQIDPRFFAAAANSILDATRALDAMLR